MKCPRLHELPPPPSGKIGQYWTETGESQAGEKDPTISWPLVSIVTPSLNQAQYLEETIRSVLLQSYPNLEYIIIDGGSTDNSVEIIQKYEPWLAYWVSEPDEGQSHALNKGFRNSHGEILAWLNSDDIYLPNAILNQVATLLKKTNYGIVFSDVNFIDDTGKLIYKGYGRSYSVFELLRFSIPMQPTVFFQREIWDQVGDFNQDFHFSLDSEYWLRASKVTKFCYEPTSIASYRLHNSSKTISNRQGFFKEWIAIADSYFLDEEEIKKELPDEEIVYAEIYARIATDETEFGSLKKALGYLVQSVKLKFRLRILKVFPLLFDKISPIKITPIIIQSWTYLNRLKI